MAQTVNKLNTLAIAQTKKPGLHGDGLGLYLLVSETGTKSWIFRYRVGSRLRNMGLGATHTVTLAQARERARECRRMRLAGIDPIDVRDAARAQARLDAAKAMTFRQCAEAYIAAHRAGWRNAKHAAQWPATLETYVYPIFGGLPVQAVDVGLVMKVIEPIWVTKSETASRVRGRIESALDWATARGYRQGENPARWRGHLENLLPATSRVARVEHHAALPYGEIGEFMLELREQEGVAARALEFAILTAARTEEVIGARWNEVNLAERLWTVPAERMKAEREHRVPLSDAAMAILDQMQQLRQNDFIFPGTQTGRPLGNSAMLHVLKRMGRRGLVVHGFRATFSTWCTERTTFPSELREMALAHTVGDAVERAYQRSDMFDRRREVLNAWARYSTTGPVRGEVIEMRR